MLCILAALARVEKTISSPIMWGRSSSDTNNYNNSKAHPQHKAEQPPTTRTQRLPKQERRGADCSAVLEGKPGGGGGGRGCGRRRRRGRGRRASRTRVMFFFWFLAFCVCFLPHVRVRAFCLTNTMHSVSQGRAKTGMKGARLQGGARREAWWWL